MTTLTAADEAALPATIIALLPALSADRDARVTAAHGLACIEMDDAGYGAFERMCSPAVADVLVRIGAVRDAR